MVFLLTGLFLVFLLLGLTMDRNSNVARGFLVVTIFTITTAFYFFA
jgi:hypothetical protein